MKTHFQIGYPQHAGATAIQVADSRGNTLPRNARADVRKGKGYPIRLLTRAEWDDLNKASGPYLAAYQPRRPVPDVDFEAEDGTLHKTAEECLRHELKKRFGCETLDEVEAKMKMFIQDQNALADQIPADDGNETGYVKADDLRDANGNPLFSGVPVEPAAFAAKTNGGCPPDCGHTEAQHADFDRGLKDGEESDPDSETPPDTTGVTDMEAYEAGFSIGQFNRAHPVNLTRKDPASPLITPSPTRAEAVTLLTSALSRRGLKPAEAAKATGLTSQECRQVVADNPDTFHEHAGKLFLK